MKIKLRPYLHACRWWARLSCERSDASRTLTENSTENKSNNLFSEEIIDIKSGAGHRYVTDYRCEVVTSMDIVVLFTAFFSWLSARLPLHQIQNHDGFTPSDGRPLLSAVGLHNYPSVITQLSQEARNKMCEIALDHFLYPAEVDRLMKRGDKLEAGGQC